MKYGQILLLMIVCSFSINIIKASNATSVIGDTIGMSYTAKEVVIESFKQNSNISALPIAVTLLSDQVINDYNITSIKEITALAPNLFIPDYGSKMTSPAYIRGIGSRINSPSVGLYVDGVPYFDRSSLDINMNDIERVEILRGPQGTLYGRNTMGGIINVYTKSPFKYKETNVNLSAGSYDNYGVALSHFGQASNTFGYSASGSYTHSGGYFDNKTTNKKADPMDAVSSRIRLNWRVIPRLDIQFVSTYEYSDQDGYPYRLYNSATGETQAVNYNAPSYYRRNISSNGINAEYTANRFKISSQTSFQYVDGKQGLDQDFSPVDKFYVDFNHRQQMFSQEFNIKSIGQKKYEWQFGAFGFHQSYKTNNHVNYRELDRQTLQNVDQPEKGAALYHQSTLNDLFVRGLSLIAGVRYDWEKTEIAVRPSSITSGADPIDGAPIDKSVIFSQVTPKASLQYTFAKDNLVYFSIAKGYKTGGFNTNTSLDKEENRTFDPEHSWSYELGTKAGCLNNMIYTDISLFYIQWSDQQISQTQAIGGGYLLRNAGRSESKGIEITTHANLFPQFNLHLSYGYTLAKFKKYEVTESLNYNNNYLPMVPRNTLSAAADYTIHLTDSWLDKILINGQYAGVGKLYWNEKNTAEQPFYGVVNGKISLIKNKFSVDLWAKNITGKDYITYYFEIGKDEFVQKSKPFSFGTNINLKF